MKIAVIGSGISGLSAAHFLSKKHKVDLFEKNDHFGGHSYTVKVSPNNSNERISVDLGFIVFNKTNYPNLLNLFEKLQVNYEKSNMSFSVSVRNSKIEYSGAGLRGLFSNKYNIFSFDFIKMIKEIFFFYKKANKMDKKNFIHANFKLSRNGGYLALIKPDKKTVVFDYSPTYPIQFSDVSYGSSMLTTSQNTTLGKIKGYFLKPTPGKVNHDSSISKMGPIITQVKHKPKILNHGETLLVTTKILSA